MRDDSFVTAINCKWSGTRQYDANPDCIKPQSQRSCKQEEGSLNRYYDYAEEGYVLTDYFRINYNYILYT